MDTKHYFESVGAWPRQEASIAVMYVLGFVLSLGLTLGAYFIATNVSASNSLFAVLLVLAVVQFLVQTIFFLHLGFNRASRERLAIFCAALIVVLILVAGSLWIMSHLNERMMMDPSAMENYMNDQTGI